MLYSVSTNLNGDELNATVLIDNVSTHSIGLEYLHQSGVNDNGPKSPHQNVMGSVWGTITYI